MRLNSFVASLAIMLMPFAATAQTNGANQPNIPAHISETIFVQTDQYFDIIEYQMENQQQIFKDAREGRAKEAYDKIAAKAGMTEPEAVAACLGNPDILRHIQDNVQRARLGGVEGVPAFFINGQLYKGPSDADSLIDLVKTLDKNRGIDCAKGETIISLAKLSLK